MLEPPSRYQQIVALKADGAGTEMDDLAAGTGGSVQTTLTDSSDIVAAILQVRIEYNIHVDLK